MLDARTLPTFNPESVLSKVAFDDGGNCWEWYGYVTHHGYGVYGKYGYMAHRVVYELLVGTLGPEESIDHLCQNRRCVNPEHMEVVTLRENVLRSNNPYAINSRKTHCLNGHEFTEANTYIHPKRGHRQCKVCRRNASLKYLRKG